MKSIKKMLAGIGIIMYGILFIIVYSSSWPILSVIGFLLLILGAIFLLSGYYQNN